MKVCIIEKDKQIGGCLQTFALEKKVFDSCVHYVGGLGESHTLNKIFSYAGIMDKLKLKAYDANAFDKIIFGDETLEYPLAQGLENFTEQLSVYFPKERKALEEYTRLLRYAGDHFPLYRLRMGDANEKAKVSNWQLTETLNRITNNTRLQNVLAGNNLLYAGTAAQTPFYLHALVTESYIHSAHKTMPGSSQIAKLLGQQLRQYVGTLLRNTEVTKLVEENGVITHAITKDGQHIHGKQFIANVHPEVLLSLVDSPLLRPAYRKRIEGLEQTISCFMLNMVLKPGTVQMRDHNLYWHASENAWAAVNYKSDHWPANYAAFFTEDEANPGYAESLSVLAYMHYNEVAQWANTNNRAGDEHERSAAYEAFKHECADKLIKKLTGRIPELQGNIIAQSTATPLTYRDYTGTPQGSLYGILKDVNKPNETTIATRTRIPNMYTTGQNVNLHGVLGVSITAIATAAEFVGMQYLLDKMNRWH